MIMVQRVAALLPVLVGVAACQVTRMPDGRLALGGGHSSYGFQGGPETVHMRTPYPKILGLNFTTDTDARTLAARLVQVYDTRGGMPGVAADVQRCYAAAQADVERASSWPSE